MKSCLIGANVQFISDASMFITSPASDCRFVCFFIIAVCFISMYVFTSAEFIQPNMS